MMVLRREYVFIIKLFLTNPLHSTLLLLTLLKPELSQDRLSLVWSQNYRHTTLYNIRYSISQNYYHYAPDATYLRLNPMVQFRIREENFRDNRKQLFMFRQVIVNREASTYITDNSKPNYSIFNARYSNTKTELIDHFSFMTDLQFAGDFWRRNRR